MRTVHLVPLSHQALELLKQIKKLSGDNELIFPGDHNPNKPMSENTINAALRTIGYDTKTEVCGHGFRAMACSALVESGLWSKDAVERQMRATLLHPSEILKCGVIVGVNSATTYS
ncbi:Prophage CP4-57 integrase [Photorhabdus australis subsp. thailandensis]|uniref:Prophage CP4-57 integrase n=1 Tax=Photorhabdus australis subsp. thailandensis TaxID=2805096 RepID=A0A1C0TYC9_9GAMM|nr:Prophage CP4-57 integrase [Photorhabdus australis subsp. thailandensis]